MAGSAVRCRNRRRGRRHPAEALLADRCRVGGGIVTELGVPGGGADARRPGFRPGPPAPPVEVRSHLRPLPGRAAVVDRIRRRGRLHGVPDAQIAFASRSANVAASAGGPSTTTPASARGSREVTVSRTSRHRSARTPSSRSEAGTAGSSAMTPIMQVRADRRYHAGGCKPDGRTRLEPAAASVRAVTVFRIGEAAELLGRERRHGAPLGRRRPARRRPRRARPPGDRRGRPGRVRPRPGRRAGRPDPSSPRPATGCAASSPPSSRTR